MNVTMMLCDFVSEVGQKLFITGGGWDRQPAGKPKIMGVAVLVDVERDEADADHEVALRLVTAAGEQVFQHGAPVGAGGKFQIGQGTGHDLPYAGVVPLAMNFAGIILETGVYKFELLIDNELMGTRYFDVVGGE